MTGLKTHLFISLAFEPISLWRTMRSIVLLLISVGCVKPMVVEAPVVLSTPVTATPTAPAPEPEPHVDPFVELGWQKPMMADGTKCLSIMEIDWSKTDLSFMESQPTTLFVDPIVYSDQNTDETDDVWRVGDKPIYGPNWMPAVRLPLSGEKKVSVCMDMILSPYRLVSVRIAMFTPTGDLWTNEASAGSVKHRYVPDLGTNVDTFTVHRWSYGVNVAHEQFTDIKVTMIGPIVPSK